MDQVPEATYSFRPLPAVRTWSGLCGEKWMLQGGGRGKSDMACLVTVLSVLVEETCSCPTSCCCYSLATP